MIVRSASARAKRLEYRDRGEVVCGRGEKKCYQILGSVKFGFLVLEDLGREGGRAKKKASRKKRRWGRLVRCGVRERRGHTLTGLKFCETCDLSGGMRHEVGKCELARKKEVF